MSSKSALLPWGIKILWTLVVQLEFLACQSSNLNSELETYNLKLSKREYYSIDLAYFSQQMIKDFKTMTYTHLNPGYNSTMDPLSYNVKWWRFLSYSDNFTLKECATNLSSAFHGNVSFPNGAIFSRNMIAHNGTFYVVTVYQAVWGMLRGVVPPTGGYNNRIETMSVSFSVTGPPVVKELFALDWPGYYKNFSTYTAPEYSNCYTGVYIPQLKETFAVCRRFTPANLSETLYLMRSGNEQIQILMATKNSLLLYKEQIQIKAMHIGAKSYEFWIFIPHYSRVFWLATADETGFTQFRKHTLVYCVVSVDFVARHLLIMTLNVLCNNVVNDRRIFWYLRNPGELFNIEQPNLLIDGTFLNWYSSNEDTELIFETYKFFGLPVTGIPGQSHVILLSSFSFNVITRKIALTRAVIFSAYYGPTIEVDLRSIMSFRSRENSRYLMNLDLKQYQWNSVQQKYVDTGTRAVFASWYMMDPYTGFIPTYTYNTTWNTFTRFPISKDYRENNFFFVAYANQLSWSGRSHLCSVVRQDLGSEQLEIKNTLEMPNFFRYLNLSFQDPETRKNMFRFNIEFLQEDEILPQQSQIWHNSQDSQYQEAVQDSQKYVALKVLVRGSFVIPYLGPDFPDAVDYTRASESTIKTIEKAALFTMESFPFSSLSDDMIGSELEDCVGLLFSSPQFVFEKTFLFVKKIGVSQTFVYEYTAGNTSLVRKAPVPISSRISWAHPIEKNFYFLVEEEGGFFTFEAETETLNNIPYVGTSCMSVAMAYHQGIKPSVVCLNQNFELAYYYVDQLLSKSLINSRLGVDTPGISSYLKHSNIKSCSIKTSDEFEGKVFVYCPATQKEGATVSIFYLEVEGNLQVIFIETVNFMTLLPDQYRIQMTKVNTFDAIGDNLVVGFKGALGVGDSVAVWKYERQGYFKLMKIADLPMEWLLDDKQALHFKRHFISNSFYNTPASLLLGLQSPSTQDHNLVFVDLKSPEIETFRTTVLPRPAKGSSFHAFPLFGYTQTNQRLLYAGIVHWHKLDTLRTATADFVPRVHIIYPGEPKVRAPKDNSHDYLEVFNAGNVSVNPTYKSEFESLVALKRSQRNPLSKSFQLIRPKLEVTTVRNQLPDIRLDYEHKLTNFTNQQKSDVVIFSKPFRQLFNVTSLDWTYQAESIFDSVSGTVSIVKPLEWVSTTQTGLDLEGMIDYREVCLKYSQPNSTKTCIEKGTILYYSTAVVLRRETSVTSWNPEKMIMYNFTNDKCTPFWTVNDKLISLCTFALSRRLVIFDPMTLELNYSLSASSFNFEPERTMRRQASIMSVHFIQLSTVVTDDFNRKGIGRSLLYVYTGNVLETDQVYSHTRLRELIISDIQQADQCFVGKYNLSSGTFFVTVNSVAVGNYKQLKFSQRITMEVKDSNRTDPSRSTISGVIRGERAKEKFIRFTTPDYSRVKEEIFGHIQLLPLQFDFRELYFNSSDFTDDYINTLIYLPNYHSFIVRFSGVFHPCNSSIYRLWNVFQGMMNEYITQTPTCHFWACATVYQKGSKSFVSLYDMDFESIRQQPIGNFQEVFKTENTSVNCSAPPDAAVFDLTMVPQNYTRYPMQILNLTNVERVQFDTTKSPYIYTKHNINDTFSEDTSDYTLRLLVFLKDGAVSEFQVSRSLRIRMNSPSVSSEYLSVHVTQPNMAETSFKVWVPSYLMKKYRIIPVCLYLAAVVLAAGMIGLLVRVQLRNDRTPLRSETTADSTKLTSSRFSTSVEQEVSQEFKPKQE